MEGLKVLAGDNRNRDHGFSSRLAVQILFVGIFLILVAFRVKKCNCFYHMVQSHRRSKCNAKARKASLSCFREMKGCEKHSSCVTIGEEQQISSGLENRDATNANVDSIEVCTPIDRTKRTTLGQLKTSRKNFRVTKRLKKRKTIHLEPVHTPAIENKDSNLVDIEIEGIDLAEFKSRRKHSKSNLGLSTRQEFMGYFPEDSSKTNPDSMTNLIPSSDSSACSSPNNGYGSDQGFFVQKGLSAKQEFMGFFPEASSKTNADSLSIRIPSSDSSAYLSPDDCCGSDQRFFFQKEVDNEDTDVQEIQPETIDEAVSVDQEECGFGLSKKIGPTMKKTVNERYSASASGKNICSLCKKSSSDFRESFPPGKACHFTDQAWPWSDDEDEYSDGVEIEEIDEAEFRNKATHFMSSMGLSTVQESTESHSTASSSNHDNCGSQSTSSANLYLSISSEDLCTNCNKYTSLEKKGNCDEDTDPEEIGIEKIDESEFRNKRTHFLLKMGSTAMPKDDFDDSVDNDVQQCMDKDFKHSTCTDKNGDEADEVDAVYSENKSWESIKILEDVPSPSDYKRDCCNRGADTKKTLNEVSECSKQSCLQQEHDEAERVGRFLPEDKSQRGSSTQKKSISPSHSKEDWDNCDNDDDDHVQIFHETSPSFLGHDSNEMELTEGHLASSGHYDLCTMLADSILGRGPELEMKEGDEETKQAPAAQNQNTLPLKFRFEDEVPKQVEQTEHEKEIEPLYSELDFNCALDDLGSFQHGEADLDCSNILSKETQHARCNRGMHELVLQDEHGLICFYCGHVELGPKDVLPEWAKIKRSGAGKKSYSETKQPFEPNELNLQSSIDNLTDLSNIADGTVWSIKAGVRESLYEHQREGFEFLWKNLAGSIYLKELRTLDPGEVGGCIISHAPGTGKTRLTIVFIETYLKLFPNCRPVIIAPAGMLLTWEEEFKKWNVEFPFHNLNNLEFLNRENQAALRLNPGVNLKNKNTLRMVKVHSWNSGRSILGISYSLFELLARENCIKEKTGKKRKGKIIDDKMEALRKILLRQPGLIVLDEGHTPRNQKSNIWNALLNVQTQKRIILSGTPFQNNFAELFNTLRIVRPAVADKLSQDNTFSEIINRNRVSSKRKYQAEHCQSPISEVIDQAVEKLKIHMSRFVHVHKGTILQQSLPGLRDCVVLLKPSVLQKSLIEKLEGSYNTFQYEHKVALISVHPYLFLRCDPMGEERIGIDMDAVEASKLNPNEGAKTKFVLELVRLATAMNEKVLIFSQYIQPLELIKEQLKEIFKWIAGKHILQMEGKLDQKHRQSLINIFNDPQSESKVMLASTRCCSEGISLVGASRVILLDVVWNPSVERQAICRAYRIGQKKFVYTYHLMTSGTTEADKYCRQAEKERLSELVFTSSSNECNKQKHPCFEDRIVEEMVSHVKLKEMFEKIINQPKDTDLIQTFGLTS